MSLSLAHGGGALPTFVVIGALKCGTTSLQHYLVQHSDIQMPDRKETDFFSGPANRLPYKRGYKRVEHRKAYERLFDPTSPVRGEASPNYTVHPLRSGTSERMKAMIPNARLIYLVRDPVARTLSHYHHRVSVEGERRSLRAVLSDRVQESPYICASLYALQLEQYLRYFREDQIMVVDQANLLSRRGATLRDIFDFLGVDPGFSSPHFEERLNTGSERRTYSSFNVLVRHAQASPLQRLPRKLRQRLRRTGERLVSRPLDPPILDSDLRSQLQELYGGEMQRFRALTGKTFTTWSV